MKGARISCGPVAKLLLLSDSTDRLVIKCNSISVVIDWVFPVRAEASTIGAIYSIVKKKTTTEKAAYDVFIQFRIEQLLVKTPCVAYWLPFFATHAL